MHLSTTTTTLATLVSLVAVSDAFTVVPRSPAATPGRTKTHKTTATFTPTNYTVVPDIFIQDSADFNATGYNAFTDSFGLIDKSANRWHTLTKKVEQLNRESDEYTAYKLMYLARHGEGYHNLAQSTYGTPAWNCYWSLQTTDGNITWGPDATLTPTGVAQAEAARDAFANETSQGMPVPQILYSSPFRRSASTLEITWPSLIAKGMRPFIRESFRESIGLHTCDQRSNKSVIATDYPKFDFEEPFSYHDELWGPDYEESSAQQALRLQAAFNQLFATDNRQVISITSHSGVINAIFKVINHNAFSVQTGGVVPVVVKAVGHPTATNTLLVGGQSSTATACAAGTTGLPANATTA
ncbi:phosphoglycerate mutase family protein [Pseudohyphozyma bogoriensis]|nr:phosphoglycerate mutase family protein [Pseudohyphozyma bogoriensis]